MKSEIDALPQQWFALSCITLHQTVDRETITTLLPLLERLSADSRRWARDRYTSRSTAELVVLTFSKSL